MLLTHQKDWSINLLFLVVVFVFSLLLLAGTREKANAEVSSTNKADTCNKVNFKYVENVNCPRLTNTASQANACKVINSKKTNSVANYTLTLVVSSIDKKAHTVDYTTNGSFCTDGYKMLNANGFCTCFNNNPSQSGTLSIGATGTKSFVIQDPNPYGKVCGVWQLDFNITDVDGDPNCGAGSNASVFGSGSCETGIVCTGSTNPPPPTQPPSPTAIPTPTPIPLYTISGAVYIDATKNKTYNNPPDSLYKGSQSNISISGPTKFSTTTTTGTYTTGTTLPAGNYTISYLSLPQTYEMTIPLNGPPPSYKVTIGLGTCNTGGVPDATCVNGNITNLNFGIADFYPWFQASCGDVRVDNGIIDTLPTGQSLFATNAQCSTPSLALTGNTNADFGSGKASTTNQVVGGFAYPEVFSSSSSVLDSSYPSLLSKAQNAGITPINLASVCNLTNCSLPANLAHGIYFATGDVTITKNYTFPNNANFIFLINGNLTLSGNLKITTGTTALFSTAKNIIIAPTVGIPANNANSSLDGWFIAGQNFIVNSQGNCNDLRLNIGGTVVVNALGNGGTLQNNRDLCGNDTTNPTISFTQRLDMILNAPQFLQQQFTVSEELTP